MYYEKSLALFVSRSLPNLNPLQESLSSFDFISLHVSASLSVPRFLFCSLTISAFVSSSPLFSIP